MDICNCDMDLNKYLCDIPNEWRDGVVKALCFVLNINNTGCSGIKECETVTSLSPFTLNGTTLSISYTNERGTISTATVDISPLMEDSLDDIDPLCLMSQEAWNALSHEERMNSVVDMLCPCCITTTTTTTTSTSTTSTTSTSSSTTTTTTIPCQQVLITAPPEEGAMVAYINCSNSLASITLAAGASENVCIYPGTIGSIFGLTPVAFTAVLTGSPC